MIEAYAVFLCLAVLAARLVMAAAVIAGSGWYDAAHAPKKTMLRNRKPHINLVVVAHNHQDYIEACLESIRASSYKKCTVIVADNYSADRTKARIKQFMQHHPQMDIKLLAKRKQAPFAAAAQQGLDKYSEDGLALAIGADSLLDAQTLARAAHQFRACSQLAEVHLNQRVLASDSLFGLWQRFAWLGRWQRLKLIALFKRNNTAAYLEDAFVYTQANTSFKTFLEGGGRSLALLDPLVIGYFFYVAYALEDATLLTLSVVALAGWLGFLVWTATRMPLVEKIRLSLHVPAVCLLYLVRAAVKPFTVLKTPLLGGNRQ